MKRFTPIFCLLGVLIVAGSLIYPRWHQQNLNAALLQAVATDNGGEATFLIEDGADVNSHGPLNWTPLMQAAMNGNAPIVQMLVSKGAQLEPKQPTGNTALYVAAQQGRPDCVKILLDKGADPNVSTSLGHSVLDVAESMRRVRMGSSQPLRHPTVADMDGIIAALKRAGAKSGGSKRSER